jgi:hypothetical protein
MTVEGTVSKPALENSVTVAPSQYPTMTLLVVVRFTSCQDLVEMRVDFNRSA